MKPRPDSWYFTRESYLICDAQIVSDSTQGVSHVTCVLVFVNKF